MAKTLDVEGPHAVEHPLELWVLHITADMSLQGAPNNSTRPTHQASGRFRHAAAAAAAAAGVTDTYLSKRSFRCVTSSFLPVRAATDSSRRSLPMT